MHLVLDSVLKGILGSLWRIAIESTTQKNLDYDFFLSKPTGIVNNNFLGNITFPKITFTIVYINKWLFILIAFNRFNPLYTYLGVINLGFIRRSKMAKDVVCLTILSDAQISFLFQGWYQHIKIRTK